MSSFPIISRDLSPALIVSHRLSSSLIISLSLIIPHRLSPSLTISTQSPSTNFTSVTLPPAASMGSISHCLWLNIIISYCHYTSAVASMGSISQYFLLSLVISICLLPLSRCEGPIPCNLWLSLIISDSHTPPRRGEQWVHLPSLIIFGYLSSFLIIIYPQPWWAWDPSQKRTRLLFKSWGWRPSRGPSSWKRYALVGHLPFAIWFPGSGKQNSSFSASGVNLSKVGVPGSSVPLVFVVSLALFCFRFHLKPSCSTIYAKW